MLKITDDYLEDEIRDGFYIPSMTKRTWAMELTVLDLIDEICRRHDITYFADWGTYLGAVRHGGFVPWDDDLDICMHRNEFEKFKKYAEREMPDGYKIITFHNNDYSWKFIVNVAPYDHMCFEPEYLKSHYAFPYIVGIDIFIIDNLSDDEELEESKKERIKKLLTAADSIDAYVNDSETLYIKICELDNKSKKSISRDSIDTIKKLVTYVSELGVSVDASMPVIEFKRAIYSEVENILKSDNNHDTEKVVQKIPWWLYHNKAFPKEYFTVSTRIPFEMINISVPMCYDRGMRIKYGDYMKIVMGAGGHDYPYYMGQKATLGTDLEYPVLYKFNEADLNIEKDFTGSLKSVASEIKAYLVESCNVITGIAGGIIDGTNEYSFEEITGFLADVQDNVIQFGTLVEQVMGSDPLVGTDPKVGSDPVKNLEELCEKLFLFSQAISTESDDVKEYASCVTNAVKDITDCIEKISVSIDACIINRRTVLIMPVKAKYWNSLKPIFERECRDENTDVYVVTLPYFYKEYDGSFKTEIQYEGDKLEKLISESLNSLECEEGVTKLSGSVRIMHYDNCNLSLICPDVIYTNNPYDEFNMSSSVPQYFYSKNIIKYTEKLVYVPFFKTMEFEKSNHPCWYNMQYYCTVPGVAIADEVWVQSENIKNRYVEKLSEWEDKNSVTYNSNGQVNWESKIKVITDIYPDYFDIEISIPDGLKAAVRDARDNNKKILVWYINAGTLMEYEDAYFEKIERCLKTFSGSRDKISVFMGTDPGAEELLKLKKPEIYEKWQGFVNGFVGSDPETGTDPTTGSDPMRGAGTGVYVNRLISKEEMSCLVDIADAYYGNPSIICKDFEIKKKPVMIQNVEL